MAGGDNGSVPFEPDPRSLALVVFQKLHQELGRAVDEPADADLLRWITEAIELHPDMIVEPGARPHEVLLFSAAPAPRDAEPHAVALNIRQTMDALRLLLREYREATNTDDPAENRRFVPGERKNI